MGSHPHLAVYTENAVDVGGQLLLVSPAELSQLKSKYQVVPIERVLFGFRISYLPDLMTSPHVSGANERERLAEILERQTQIVANLGKWRGMAFVLRYLAQPSRGEIEVHLLARVRHEAGQGKPVAERVAADLASNFASVSIQLEPATTAKELDSLLEPLSQPYVFQLRQREEQIPLQLSSPAYVVYPFRRPVSTWIQACEVMLRQRASCLVSIHLEPTQLDDGERQAFANVSAFAERMSDFTYRGLAGEYRIPDPQARVVAQLHSDYLRRLSAPYLLAVHVASPDQAAAFAIAQALGAEITESSGIEVASREGGLPCGFDLIAPATTEDLSAAQRNVKELRLDHWGRNLDADRRFELEDIPPGKRRLCFLADAKTANAAFRFPVAIRGGIPGIKTRQVLPSYETGARLQSVAPGEILLGKFADRGGVAGVPVQLFTRHTLVAGTNGSGKTTTYRDQHKLPERISEEKVEARMAAFRKEHASLELPFDGCRYCLRQCRYRDRVGPVAYEVESGKRFRKALRSFEEQRHKGDEVAGWAELVKSCQETLEPAGLATDEHAAYCYIVHLWSHEATDAMARRFRQVAAGG